MRSRRASRNRKAATATSSIRSAAWRGGRRRAPPPAPTPVAIEPDKPEPIEKSEKQEKAAAERPEEERGDRLANHSIRVNVDTLDHLMTTVSELVLTRNQLLEIVRRHEDSDFKVPLQRLSNVTAELQEGVMKTRMQPIGNAWQKLPRVVRDLCAELGKDIELSMRGADTELDRQVLDLVKDPLTHLVRNCADHGIESPAERIAAGKPAKGTIRLSAWHEGGHIIIEISDDGRGLDLAGIKAKAIEKGLASEAQLAAKSEAEICNFIFAPGFTTAAKVTSISGRGVGMDVVRNNIEQIGGTVDLKSVSGAGTTFTIKIPLTLAIVSALIVEAGGERFAIPQLAVLELVRAGNNGEHRIEHIKDAPVLRLRNKLLPLVRLKEVFRLGACDNENGFVVVTQVGSQVFGIVVDGVFHTEEIVIKPMSSKLRHIPVFSGTTILGDGSVIMIIDPNGVAQALGRAAVAAARAENSELQSREEESRRGYRLAAGVPRRLAAAEGGAVVAGDAARGDRLPQDRNLRRPPSGAIPRSAHAAVADRLESPQHHEPASRKKARSRSWCSPIKAAPWVWLPTRSSTSSRSGSTSKCRAIVRACSAMP